MRHTARQGGAQPAGEGGEQGWGAGAGGGVQRAYGVEAVGHRTSPFRYTTALQAHASLESCRPCNLQLQLLSGSTQLLGTTKALNQYLQLHLLSGLAADKFKTSKWHTQHTHLPGGDMLASLSMLHLLSIMDGLGTDTDMRGVGMSMSSAAMEPAGGGEGVCCVCVGVSCHGML
jgi:hypothetical protein